MARTTLAAIEDVHAAATEGVLTNAHLRRRGLTSHAIALRCRPGGPWRRVLPGVVLLGNEEPTRWQQLLAAHHYARPGSVVTGLDALRAHGIRLRPSGQVHVLVPLHRRILSRDFVNLERTSRLPEPVSRDDVAFAPPARATIDAARLETNPDRLRRLLSLPVYYGLSTADDLRSELEAGNQRGTAAVRDMLRNLGSLEEAYLHGVAREVLECVPLPPPIWNVRVCDLQGRPIGLVDAWWDEVALGWQFGAGEARARGPKMNDLALTAAGVVVVRTPATELRSDVRRTARELTSAFATATRRRRPQIQAQGMLAPGL
jgi:hypothetical protein